MKKKLLNISKFLIFSTIFTACSVVGYRTSEEASYILISAQKNIEIRQLEPSIIAEVSIFGDYNTATNIGFKKLAKYIFGENNTKDKIAMTAPVVQEKNEKIAMTSPVIQEKQGDNWIMQFSMPKKYTIETLPIPIDSDILIKQIPEKKVAVLIYSGLLTESKINLKTTELQTWLSQNNYKEISSPRSSGYDPPWTIPFFRKNEITIDIE
ncbi:SOUL family heme-binding protein [Cetobacterium sp.]|uniref:SOUL family heme-binding protein n=1 Tax=Cetobacterium sp. TaxID=2071632 RepID=UPI003F3974A6